jgi:hypothetical protein
VNVFATKLAHFEMTVDWAPAAWRGVLPPNKRPAAADRLRRELTVRLEAVKLQEINQLIRSPNLGQTADAGNPAGILTAKLEGGSYGCHGRFSAPESPTFSKYRQEGEAQEFAKNDKASASAVYMVLRSATPPDQAKRINVVINWRINEA